MLTQNKTVMTGNKIDDTKVHKIFNDLFITSYCFCSNYEMIHETEYYSLITSSYFMITYPLCAPLRKVAYILLLNSE